MWIRAELEHTHRLKHTWWWLELMKTCSMTQMLITHIHERIACWQVCDTCTDTLQSHNQNGIITTMPKTHARLSRLLNPQSQQVYICRSAHCLGHCLFQEELPRASSISQRWEQHSTTTEPQASTSTIEYIRSAGRDFYVPTAHQTSQYHN